MSSLRRWILIVPAVAVTAAFLVHSGGAQASAPPCRYIVTDGGPGNSTVQDTVTGLTWQQTTQNSPVSWTQAATYCSSLTYGGQAGWRMPTTKELLSLVDFTQRNPAIDSAYFPATPSKPFWSAPQGTTTSNNMTWYVDFADGYTVSADASSDFLIRCDH
jgi:hypothetical protein